VFYFDTDLSWEAEDPVIGALRRSSERFGVRIEARNQARVHLSPDPAEVVASEQTSP
jgi:uncharacterized protein